MSVILVYQSLPPGSDFYSRLQNDRAFRVLASSLFTAGNVFHIFQYVPESFNEYMEEAISRHPDVFCGTETETSLIIGDFREALRITCRDYPEIVYNAGSWSNHLRKLAMH